MSSTTPSTPIRALPSTLLSRTAPTIPPASQAYEPHVKGVLGHRQRSIFLQSAALSWVLAALWATWSRGGAFSVGLRDAVLLPIAPATLAYAGALFACGALPVVVLRKANLAVASGAASSPSKGLHDALHKKSTAHALLTYLVSSLCLTALHLLLTVAHDAASGTDSRLTIFVKSKKHPYYLNGRFLYLVTSQALLALASIFRCILLDRFTVRWSSSLTSKADSMKSFTLARAITVLLTTSVFTVLVTAAHLLLFAIARSAVLPILLKLPIISTFLRPFSAHFLRGAWLPALLTRHWSLISRTAYVSLTTLAIWEFSESAFDGLVAEPISVALQTADPGVALVSGISSADAYIKHFAYAELKEFANDDSASASARRTALFGDQKYNPSMWSSLCREALLTLGHDYQYLLRRGKPAPPAPATPAPTRNASPLPAPATPLLRQPILKASTSSPLRAALDTLGSDGPFATTAEAGASHLPELFRSVMPSSPPTVPLPSIQAAEQSAEHAVAALKSKVTISASAYVPAALSTAHVWWTRPRLHRVAEGLVPNRQLDALATQALCALVCASLAEDRFGVVQRDIPRIVEALLAFLGALDDYHAELVRENPVPAASETDAEGALRAEELARAGEALSVVSDAIKEGIVQIVRTFGEKLAAFKFPPRTARKLQGFVDYN